MQPLEVDFGKDVPAVIQIEGARHIHAQARLQKAVALGCHLQVDVSGAGFGVAIQVEMGDLKRGQRRDGDALGDPKSDNPWLQSR